MTAICYSDPIRRQNDKRIVSIHHKKNKKKKKEKNNGTIQPLELRTLP